MRKQLIKDIEDFLRNNTQVFNSECEFQLYLGGYLKQKGYTVHLEYLVKLSSAQLTQWHGAEYEKCKKVYKAPALNGKGKKLYIDIVVEADGKFYPIELKYKTAKPVDSDDPIRPYLGCVFNNSTIPYVPENQGAANEGCYDYLRDIERVDKLQYLFGNVKRGIAVLYTNDDEYWRLPTNANMATAAFAPFTLREGTHIAKEQQLKWNEVWAKTIKRSSERYYSISLDNSITINWKDTIMSDVIQKKGKNWHRGFRYIIH